MYWDRGLNQAPDLVRICVESWERRNPGWTVRVLDEKTLPHWVDMIDVRKRNPRLTIQAYADILRWRLLAAYGGVWADATLYCCKPLDTWLSNSVAPKGFFAFRSPQSYLYHSWFLAGDQGNPVVAAMNEELDRYFIEFGGYRYYWELRGIWRICHFIEQRIGKFNYELWRNYFFRKFLKATPYFLQNYLTGAAIRRYSAVRSEFESVTVQYGECPHALQMITDENRPPQLDEVCRVLDGPCPVQKLTTKRFVEEWTVGGVLELLDQYGRG